MTVRRTLAMSVAALLVLMAATSVLSVLARQRTTVALSDLEAGQQLSQRLLSIDRELQLRWREVSVLRELSPTREQVALVHRRLDILDGHVNEVADQADADPFLAGYRPLVSAWRRMLEEPSDDREPVVSPSAALDALSAWRSEAQAATTDHTARFAAALRSADRLTVALLAVSLLVGLAIVAAFTFVLTSGFARLDVAARHVAEGDYLFRLKVTGDSEFGRAARTFNDMAAALAAASAETEAARARAEDASAEKSDFLASLCHDLKTPLTAILGYADIIEGDVQRAGLVVSTADVQQLRRSAGLLLGMVSELLDYARLEGGRMPVALDVTDPVQLIREVADTMQPMLEQRGNTFSLEDRSAGTLTTDAGKLRHVVLNLLANACKFTRDGRVDVLIARLDSTPGVMLQVRDTGIGMTPDEVARVFAPYVQANKDIAQRYGGSGLGLAIAKQFAQRLGGDLSVTSAPGRGATFVLTVPDQAGTVERELDEKELEEAVALFAALDEPRHTRLSA